MSKVKIFQDLINALQSLRPGDKNALDLLRKQAEMVIRRVCGDQSPYLPKLALIHYYTPFSTEYNPERWQSGTAQLLNLLTTVVKEIETFDTDGSPNASAGPIDYVRRICERFHIVSRQLLERHDGRPTLEIENEYDVQDLMHALLRLFFDDIRPEEWTPSYVGGSSRMDFLIKEENLVLETKKSRKSMTAKVLGDELIIDIQRYKQHPNCKTLICFVYDPDGWIANPVGIEKDLSRRDENLNILVLIVP